MGKEAGEGFKREGTYVYLWPIHVDVWQKPTQYCNYPLSKNKMKKKRFNEILHHKIVPAF